MPRATNSVASRRRRKRVLNAARGYWGGRSRLYRTARESVNRALVYAYRDRKRRKGDFRRLWILRINAAARLNGISYSRFIYGLKRLEWLPIARLWPTWQFLTPLPSLPWWRRRRCTCSSGVAPFRKNLPQDIWIPSVHVFRTSTDGDLKMATTTTVEGPGTETGGFWIDS